MNRFFDALYWAHYYDHRGLKAIGIALLATFVK
jgi:hypothetical protein